MSDNLAHFSCEPYQEKMFDLTSNKMMDGTVSGFWVRLFGEQPPAGCPSLKVGPAHWIISAPDFKATGQAQ